MEQEKVVSIPVFRMSRIPGVMVCELPEKFNVINRHGFRNPMMRAESIRHLIVDFRACKHIDTAALGALVTVNRHLRGHHRRMVLVNTYHEEVDAALLLCKLDSVFEMRDSLTDGLQALSSSLAHA